MRKVYDAVIIGSGAAAYSAADWLLKKNIKNNYGMEIDDVEYEYIHGMNKLTLSVCLSGR